MSELKLNKDVTDQQLQDHILQCKGWIESCCEIGESYDRYVQEINVCIIELNKRNNSK